MRTHTLAVLSALFWLACTSSGDSSDPVADVPDSAAGEVADDEEVAVTPDVSLKPDVTPDTGLPEMPCQPQCSVCGADNGCGEVCVHNDLCSDGLVCTMDHCDPEKGCVFVTDHGLCDDSKPCTDDLCVSAEGCTNEPREGACDDDNLCTMDDQCLDGQCLGAGQLECDDENVCTDDSCDPMDGCTYANNTAMCNDGDVCTKIDDCVDGVCTGSDPMDCDDGNPCTDDFCHPEGGCAYTFNDIACDDSSDCTVDEACIAGECIGSGSLDCDDGNPCTYDSCLDDGGCAYENLSEIFCGDGTICTSGDTCQAGQCIPGAPLDCDDGNPCTVDICHPEEGCQYEMFNGPCDDGNPCTESDVCQDQLCTGLPLVCIDGEQCIEGVCECINGCLDKACGFDGCGNYCGHCEYGLYCEENQCVGIGGCPQPGPYGSNVGQPLPDATLYDCEGNPYTIHDLCQHKATWMVHYAGW